MNEFVSFIKENYISIAVTVSIIFVLLIIISIREWDLNPPKPDSKLVQQVVVETFQNEMGQRQHPDPNKKDTNEIDKIDPNETGLLGNKNNATMKELQSLKLSPTDSFCQSHLGKSAELETSCNQLTEDGCQQTSCCVLINSSGTNRCMAGDKNGPTFKKDKDGNLISMDSYYYQGIKRDVVPL